MRELTLATQMENLPGILNHSGQNIAEDMYQVLKKSGYAASYTFLKVAFCGVPQMRACRTYMAGHSKVIA